MRDLTCSSSIVCHVSAQVRPQRLALVQLEDRGVREGEGVEGRLVVCRGKRAAVEGLDLLR